MAFVAGIVLALAVALFAQFNRLDHDRAFYPTVLAVIASRLMFCLSYDLTSAVWLASLLNRAGVEHASVAVRSLGIEVKDALEIAEQTEL